MPVHTAHARDAALRKLKRANRVLLAGSVVLTGVLSDVAANAFGGRTIKSTSGKRASPPLHASSSSGSSATPSRPLRPPEQAPQATTEAQPPAASQEPSQPAPSQEAPPSRESTPSQEAPAQEAAPPHQAPSQEPAPPAVSGGS